MPAPPLVSCQRPRSVPDSETAWLLKQRGVPGGHVAEKGRLDLRRAGRHVPRTEGPAGRGQSPQKSKGPADQKETSRGVAAVQVWNTKSTIVAFLDKARELGRAVDSD